MIKFLKSRLYLRYKKRTFTFHGNLHLRREKQLSVSKFLAHALHQSHPIRDYTLKDHGALMTRTLKKYKYKGSLYNGLGNPRKVGNNILDRLSLYTVKKILLLAFLFILTITRNDNVKLPFTPIFTNRVFH